MLELKAKHGLLIIAYFSLSVLDVTGQSGAENISDKTARVAPIHANSVLKPGPEGKELVKGLVGKPGKGKAIYNRYCVYCHGKKGRGDGMVAIGLTPSPADLSATFKYVRGVDEPLTQRLFDVITYGRKGSDQIRMPAWGPVLSKQERIDVLAYVKSMFAD